MALRETNLLDLGLGAQDICIGQLIGISPDGNPLVEYPGNRLGPLAARFVEGINLSPDRCGVTVLLVFEQRDPTRPVIAGVLLERLAATDDRRVLIEARQEIEIRCGKSSIVLKKDGKLNIRGSDVTSRASGVNKVRGSAVKIN
jgi:hypothetical protein